ncbi:transcription initiation factor TFIID subunit 5-like [Physella acuta]|uniref:transcription initiation factor TFIID subunit 5-like n=1 Tax=Physella acuta TaxID=109671 RepID=UPI0027DD0C91|nr:transcription initiation factor TFIID subunit 5-like [Physella acuta]
MSDSNATVVVKQEPEDAENSCKYDKQTLLAVLQFLKKHNLKETENLLKQEAKVSDDDLKTEDDKKTEVSQALAAVYKSDDDPSLYEDLYNDLKTFIDSCLDVHKVELSIILYPIFVHMYLELVYNDHEWNAAEFYTKFWQDQEEHHHEDLAKLAIVRKKEHMNGDQLLENFKTSKFVLRMSRDSYTHLKRHLQEKRLSPLLTIIQDHLFIDVFDGVPRTHQQIQATSGGLLGEVDRDANKAKVFFGLLKEPDLNIQLDEEEEAADGDEKPKKKKSKKDPLLMKKSKNDPNAPPVFRIPLPELKDQDHRERALSYREAKKRAKLDHSHLPSICFYTFLNSYQGVTSVDVTDDSSMMAAGFADGNVRVWSLTPNKLREMKDPDDLDMIDKEADDVMERIFDERTASDNKKLAGHSGSVYAVSFSPDRAYLLSSSDDGTIRLWSLLVWTNLVCYKGHNFPVWDVKFSPHGYYFASAGHDRTARVWATDHYQPLRIFAGHLADVDCCQFHPNSNYVATGSSDKSVRLWDMLNGSCVRVMTGHKGTIHCLQFSPDGRYLASAGADNLVLVWDLSTGTLVAQLKGHTNIVYCICFSRDGTMLASGGLDDSIRLWDINKVLAEQDTETDTSIPSNVNVNDSPSLLLGTYLTKSSTILGLHFTRRNLLIGCGPFIAPSS